MLCLHYSIFFLSLCSPSPVAAPAISTNLSLLNLSYADHYLRKYVGEIEQQRRDSSIPNFGKAKSQLHWDVQQLPARFKSRGSNDLISRTSCSRLIIVVFKSIVARREKQENRGGYGHVTSKDSTLVGCYWEQEPACETDSSSWMAREQWKTRATVQKLLCHKSQLQHVISDHMLLSTSTFTFNTPHSQASIKVPKQRKSKSKKRQSRKKQHAAQKHRLSEYDFPNSFRHGVRKVFSPPAIVRNCARLCGWGCNEWGSGYCAAWTGEMLR